MMPQLNVSYKFYVNEICIQLTKFKIYDIIIDQKHLKIFLMFDFVCFQI